MRRTLAYLIFVVFAFILVGCDRSAEKPTPTVATLPTNIPIVAPSSGLPTPAPIAQSLSPSPIPLPTVTPSPIPVVQPSSLPYPENRATDSSLIEVTPVPAAPQLTCTARGKVTACYDELLNMIFSYPAFMGKILYTQLRQGGYSGYAYEYAFDNSESRGGGRSKDFSEGRGPMYTDHKGFNGRDPEDICSDWFAAMCEVLGPGALLIVILPQAEWLCSDAMMFQPTPRGILVLDLPQHPLINGFSFTFNLLSVEATAVFEDRWYNGQACEPETKVALGEAMNQLATDLRVGTADPEIQQRYDAFFALAESIQSPYIATKP